jgi:chromosome segregation ATPase
MLWRVIKFGSVAAGGGLLLGGLIFGGDLTSYVGSSARQVRRAVKDQVSVEFELQRARDLVEGIVPDLRSNIRLIAQEEVEVAQLQNEIAVARDELADRAAQVSQIRDALETRQVSYRIASQNYTREEMAERLANRFGQLKQTESILASKEKLLAAREKSLEAARRMLEKTRTQKVALEQKIEGLVAQHRLVKAQAATSQFAINVDSSQLSRADQLVREIQQRLDVAQRVLAHETDLLEMDPLDSAIAGVSEDELLAEVDRHLGRDAAEVAANSDLTAQRE